MLFVVIPSLYLMFGCLLRLTSNLAVANRVDAVVVTKTETVTIGELFSFMKQEVAKIVQYQ